MGVTPLADVGSLFPVTVIRKSRNPQTTRQMVFIQTPCYPHHMPNLQIHNMPEDLHRRLRLYAAEQNCTTSEAVIMAIQRELERWDWKKRLAQRPKTNLGIPVADLLAQERSSSIERLDGSQRD